MRERGKKKKIYWYAHARMYINICTRMYILGVQKAKLDVQSALFFCKIQPLFKNKKY